MLDGDDGDDNDYHDNDVDDDLVALVCTLLKSYSQQLVQVSVRDQLFSPRCHIASNKPNVQEGGEGSVIQEGGEEKTFRK